MLGVLSGNSLTFAHAAGDKAGSELARAGMEVVGQQEEFNEILQGVLELHPDAVVDFAWNVSHGLITVKPDALGAVREEVAEVGVDIVVEASADTAVAYRDRSAVESEVLDAMSEIPAEAYAARYDYERDEVIVTLWTDEQRATEERSEHLLDERDVEQEAGVSVELEYEDGADAPVENSKTRGGEAYGGALAASSALAVPPTASSRPLIVPRAREV